MVVSNNSRIILIFIVTVIILECDTQIPSMKDIIMGTDNNPLDILFGNKTVIGFLSRESSNIANRFKPRRGTYIVIL